MKRLSRRESFESILDAAGGMKLGSTREVGNWNDPMCLTQHIHRRMLRTWRSELQVDSPAINAPSPLVEAIEMTMSEQYALARAHNSEVLYRTELGEGDNRKVTPVPDLILKLKKIVAGEKVIVCGCEFDITRDFEQWSEPERLSVESQKRNANRQWMEPGVIQWVPAPGQTIYGNVPFLGNNWLYNQWMAANRAPRQLYNISLDPGVTPNPVAVG